MPKRENSVTGYQREAGEPSVNRGQARAMDLRPELPQTTHEIVGVDLTHTVYTTDVAASAKGGGTGGGGGGGTTTTFAPYTSGPATASAGYNITIEFKGSWTQAYYDVFKAAADRLTTLIIGDLQDVTVYGAKGGPKTVDDIVISAELGAIDGLYGILGQAGPTALRTSNSLPATAQMKFDIADVDAMGLATFADVVLHEMAHSLGVGSIWDRLGLVTNGLFTGPRAVAEYHAMGGTQAGIPVEQDGGSGTAGSHWDEEIFGNELMTGYINEGENYFTAMSAASFGDLGYTIRADYASLSDAGYVFA
jgi:hypothetical protein